MIRKQNLKTETRRHRKEQNIITAVLAVIAAICIVITLLR